MRARTHPKGFSIIELMVSLAITSIVMYGAFQLFQEGMQLFRVNQAASDSQVSVTKAISLLSTEVANASPKLIKHYSPAGGGYGGATGLNGLVFATPLGEDGNVLYDSKEGQLYWRRYIAFYFKANPSEESNGQIIRAEEPVPPAGTGSTNLADLENFVNTHSTTYFSTSGAAKNRSIATGISGFSVSRYNASEFAGAVAEKIAFDVVIEAGDKAQAFRNSYFLRVKVRVAPRAR